MRCGLAIATVHRPPVRRSIFSCCVLPTKSCKLRKAVLIYKAYYTIVLHIIRTLLLYLVCKCSRASERSIGRGAVAVKLKVSHLFMAHGSCWSVASRLDGIIDENWFAFVQCASRMWCVCVSVSCEYFHIIMYFLFFFINIG